jgi:lysozyme family protein
MLVNRQFTLDNILHWEGSDLNLSPNEPGGASKFGVSVDFLSDYHRKIGKAAASIADVTNLTDADARQIYSKMLLDPLRFDELPSGVDFRLADITTNLGMTGGPNLMQLCLGMYPLTGIMDNLTIGLIVNLHDPSDLVWALSAAWIAVKNKSPNWGPSPVTKSGFGHGWSNRNNAQKEAALGLIGA